MYKPQKTAVSLNGHEIVELPTENRLNQYSVIEEKQ